MIVSNRLGAILAKNVYDMIKELWKLIKMLFTSKPSDFIKKDMKVVEMKHFPFKGYKALSWCGMIIHREGTSKVDDITMNHEKIHVMQAYHYADDNWLVYYLSYYWEWLKFGLTAPISANYYISKWESQAYANECDMSYCGRFEEDDIAKYSIKNAKGLYKQLGGTSKSWKEYVKKL